MGFVITQGKDANDAAEKAEVASEATDAEPVLTPGAEDGSTAETDASEAATTGTETSEAPTTGTETSETATTGTETSEPAATGTETSETATSDETSTEQTSSTSNVPWKLIISVGVIILIIAVLFILSKTKTKLGEKIAKFFKDYKSELKKIVWMPWKDVKKNTILVLAATVAVGVMIGIVDFVFSEILGGIAGLVG